MRELLNAEQCIIKTDILRTLTALEKCS